MSMSNQLYVRSTRFEGRINLVVGGARIYALKADANVSLLLSINTQIVIFLEAVRSSEYNVFEEVCFLFVFVSFYAQFCCWNTNNLTTSRGRK